MFDWQVYFYLVGEFYFRGFLTSMLVGFVNTLSCGKDRRRSTVRAQQTLIYVHGNQEDKLLVA